MRARYYSPELRRFINADVVVGDISNSVTLNRYAYANGNPVSNIDPFGLSAERGGSGEPYLLLSDILPSVGTPNTHVIKWTGKYWKERWYGPDGPAKYDRHWTDHDDPKHHTNPHDHEWDWSKRNPLQDPYPPDSPGDEPTRELEEPWYPDDPKKKRDDSSNDDNENTAKEAAATVTIGVLFSAIVEALKNIKLPKLPPIPYGGGGFSRPGVNLQSNSLI